MTLNLTVLSRGIIYQAADFRLTNAATGALVSDQSDKIVSVRSNRWIGFITYTGIGSVANRPVSDYIKNWLQQTPDLSMPAVAEVLKQSGDDLLKAARTVFPHTFLVAGFEDGRARVYVVSNFERWEGAPFSLSRNFVVTRVSCGKRPKLIVTGAKAAVPAVERLRIERQLVRETEPAAIRQLLQETIRGASATREAAGRISAESMCFSCDFEGAMRSDRSEGVPGGAPMLVDGVDLTAIMQSMFKDASADSKPTVQLLASGTFGGGDTPIRSACQPRIVADDASYTVADLRSLGGPIAFARGVNAAGMIAGESHLTSRGPPMPVLWSDMGEPLDLEVPPGGHGGAVSVNDAGDAVGYVVAPPGLLAHAWLWSGQGKSIELDDRPDGESQARVIDAAGTIGGKVRIGFRQEEEHDMRPARWSPGSASADVLDLESGEWGQVVGSDDNGTFLLSIHSVGSRSSAWLWTASGALARLSPNGNEVEPVAIDSTGRFVLGVASGTPVLLSDRSFGWEPIDCTPGSSVCGVNCAGTVLGSARADGFARPWVKLFGEPVQPLPYFASHHTMPTAISNSGIVVGTAAADYCGHALIWKVASKG